MTGKLAAETLDVTLPGRTPLIGTVHPISQMIDEVSEIFAYLGFETVFGPEVEIGRYNFDMLNIPADHPARDVWDTIIVNDERDEVVLRTHTSPMQARVMEQRTAPLRVIVPGRVYRYEQQDASHEWMFHQIEGLALDDRITMADLKGTLTELARQLFGEDTRVRFRCDFFPFVEPGVEFAVSCPFCGGNGCRVCKQSGWIEMGGAGMVHPNVLRWVNYDPDEVQGWAFGLGVERLVMVKYGVNDIRAFAGNDSALPAPVRARRYRAGSCPRMKVPMKWLAEFVQTDLNPQELAHRLTMAGLEAEKITRIGEMWDDKVFVAEVRSVEKHPDADRLVLADVEAGDRIG